MGTKRTIIGLAFLLSGLLITTEACGQIVYGRKASTDLRVVYSSWTLKTDTQKTTVSQFAVPINSYFPLGEGLEGQLYIDGSSSSLTGTDNPRASGLGDLRVQLNKAFGEDHFVVSAGLNAPTGTRNLKASAWSVVQSISTNFLSFPTRALGTGFGFNLLVGSAFMLGDLRCGAGVSYQYTGKYSPVKDGGDYDPGDIISANAGVAGGEPEATSWSATAIYTAYTDAKLDGKKSFKQGADVQVQAGLRRTRAESYSLSAAVNYTIRDRNKLYAYGADTVLNQLRLFGNEIGARVSYTRMLDANWSVTPAVAIRVIGKTESASGDVKGSNIVGISGTVGRKLSQSQLEAGVTYFTGKAEGSVTTVNGFQLSSTLHLAL